MSWRRAAAVAVLPWLALTGALLTLIEWQRGLDYISWPRVLLISALLYGASTWAIHTSGQLFGLKPEKPE